MMPNPRIDEIVGRSDLSPAARADVRAAIESSPYLQSVMLKAIDDGRIRDFTLSKNAHEGGHFNRETGAISINPDSFRFRNKEERLNALTGIIAHETGHALMARSAEATEYRYAFEVDQAIKEASRDGQASVDITPFARHAVNDFRSNEALAEVVSMNSMASRVAKAKGKFDLDDFLARTDAGTECIDDGKLDAGIRLNAKGLQLTGGKIDSSAVERVAVCHFDNGARTLGLKGTSTYDDTYAAYTLGAAVDVWKDYGRGTTQAMPQIAVNLATLKTSEQGVENAGIDLGGKGKAFDFIDVSNGQRRAASIQQRGDGSKTQPGESLEQTRAPVLADDPSHPDFETFNHIHQWTRGTGQWDQEKSRNVAGALYKEQLADPLIQRVDKVSGAVGQDGAENVFAVYAPFGEKGPFIRAQVEGREASHQPAQQNLEQAEQIKQQQVQQQQLEQQQLEKQQRQDQETPKGPTISL